MQPAATPEPPDHWSIDSPLHDFQGDPFITWLFILWLVVCLIWAGYATWKSWRKRDDQQR